MEEEWHNNLNRTQYLDIRHNLSNLVSLQLRLNRLVVVLVLKGQDYSVNLLHKTLDLVSQAHSVELEILPGSEIIHQLE